MLIVPAFARTYVTPPESRDVGKDKAEAKGFEILTRFGAKCNRPLPSSV